MNRIAGMAVVVALCVSGCSAVGGGAETFSEADCKVFATKLVGMSGMENNLYIEQKEVDDMRTGIVAECMADKMGVSREQLDCAVKSSNNDEFAKCGIVLKG
jgi:acetyl-CoA acetyltransferase